MAFELPSLPYAHDALEPHIDARTMEIHHGKHHQAYVDNANKALAGTNWDSADVNDVVSSLGDLPDDIRGPVRNNAGGHANHSLFWQVMGPGGGGDPSGALGDAISSTFGDIGTFKDAFAKAGVTRFGSGWAWLVTSSNGLEIMSTPNQDSPLTDGKTPLLGLDVWEHAYYLNYQNRRPDYIGAWWNVVNWDEVARRLGEA